MLKFRKDQFILFFMSVAAIMHGLNSAINSYYGYYQYEHMEIFYAFYMFFGTMYYIRCLDFVEMRGISFGLMFMMYYPVMLPYLLIKNKKFFKGVAFVLLWLIVMNIGIISSLLVDVIIPHE